MSVLFTRQFAQADTALRQGKHISRQEYKDYEFVSHNFDEMERFYLTYQCRLVQHPDGFFYLLPRGDLMPVKTLPAAAMHLGQFIALKCRDPDITRTDGRINTAALINDLETTIPAETLSRVYGRKQKEVLSGERIHEEVRRALRLLGELRFVRIEGEEIVPTEAIARFMEMARHGNEPSEQAALAMALMRGVVGGAETGEDENVREDQ